ncbi:MAG: M20/M25/M40 family metallo-hydrolase [Burkholderiaceae bacterium]
MKQKMLARLIAATFLAAPLAVAAQDLAPIKVAPAVTQAYAKIKVAPAVTQVMAALKADDARALEEQKRIALIPGFSGEETQRSKYVLQRFKELGLKDAYIDPIGNVIGVRKGTNPDGLVVVMAAHIDSVFANDTPLALTEKNGRIIGPGIADNARGVASMLSMIKVMNETGIKTVGDIIFVGDVAEEGLGDLRGVKRVFADIKNIDGFVTFDGGDIERPTTKATGSHRYEITFSGPGGHSFGAFGKVPSSIHAMGRAIAKIGDVVPPASPKTTYTVGTAEGGTSINSIAQRAMMRIDMRSNAMPSLLEVEKQILATLQPAADEENKRWNTPKAITVDIKLVGDRPAGATPDDHPLVQAADASLRSLGDYRIKALTYASTDSNLPISLGIPAITIAKGGKSGNGHSLTEWYEPADAWRAVQNGFLLTVGLVGVDGVSAPVLPNLPARK